MGTSLVVQWLRFCASNARSAGSIPGWGTKIPHAVQHGQKKKKKSNYTPVKNVKKKKKKNITQWKNFTWDYFLVSFKKHSQAQKT